MLQLFIHSVDVASRPVYPIAAGAPTEFGVGVQDERRDAIGNIFAGDSFQQRIAHRAARERGIWRWSESVSDLFDLLLKLVGPDEQGLEATSVGELAVASEQHASLGPGTAGKLVVSCLVFVAGIVTEQSQPL